MTAPADRPYHHLDAIARELWRWSVVCSGGTAEARLAHAAPWHNALLAGHLPDATMDLGDPEAVGPLRRLLSELNLLALTQGNTSLTRQMLQRTGPCSARAGKRPCRCSSRSATPRTCTGTT